MENINNEKSSEDVIVDNEKEENDDDFKHEGDKILVIHPGSLHLRIGRASDPIPITLPHCIAWKTRDSQSSNVVPWLARRETEHAEAIKMVLTTAKEAQQQLGALFRSNGKYRQPTSADELAQVNEDIEPDESEVMSQMQWTDLSDNPDYVIGDDALYINPSSGYRIIWPISYGKLNVKDEVGYSPTNLLQSMQTLWTAAINTHLAIKDNEFQDYRCIVLVPDIINRSYIRHMMSLLLDKMGFQAAFVIQESVCASFGAGLASVCVVDVGDQKTSISCVEDGISIEQTRVTLHYGGRDITRTFSWLLDHISFPYLDCQPDSNVLDCLLLQELKHTYCHMDTERYGTEEMHFQVRPPGQKITKYSMHIGDEKIISTLSVFWPDMFGVKGKTLTLSGTYKDSDHTDVMDADYISQTRSKQEESARQVAARKKEVASQNQTDEGLMEESRDVDDDVIEGLDDNTSIQLQNKTDSGSKKPSTQALQADKLIALDQAIIWSIEQCESEECRQRMYSCILVVGGGLAFPGTEHLLQYRVWLNLPADIRSTANVVVITKSKDVDTQAISWKGGSILSLLDGTSEHWITKDEWAKHQCKVAREKAPFLW